MAVAEGRRHALHWTMGEQTAPVKAPVMTACGDFHITNVSSFNVTVPRAVVLAKYRVWRLIPWRRRLDSLSSKKVIQANPHDATPLDQEIRLRHSWHSFQKPDKIAEALRLVSEVRLWGEVAARLAMSMQDVKAQLGAIADCRDRIAHEADIDPTDPSRHTRWPITPTDAQSAVDFMERLGVAILDAIK